MSAFSAEGSWPSSSVAVARGWPAAGAVAEVGEPPPPSIPRLAAAPREKSRRSRSDAVALSGAADADRLVMLDAVRLLAAYSTILIHSVAQTTELRFITPLTRFSLPLFVQVAVYTLFRSYERRPTASLRERFARRASRLLIPFLAWNGLYAGMRAAKHALLPAPQPLELGWAHLWIGSAHHLWFLPFLAGVTLYVLAVIRTTESRPALRTPLAVVLAGVGVALCWVPLPPQFDQPRWYLAERSFTMLPSVCWATAGCLLLRDHRINLENSRRVAAAGVLVALVGSAMIASCEFPAGPYRLGRVITGAGWLLVALGPARGRIPAALAVLGRCSYGIFLVHLVFVEALLSLATRCAGGQCGWPVELGVFGLSCCGATVTAVLFGRSNRWRWLFG